jgi:tRNA U34 5-carboxymethylaminomethyl modifying GTPase MnmE/TrmE
MISTSISNLKDEVIIKINKSDFSEEFVQNIIEKINLEKLTNKSKLTEAHIYSLKEDIKTFWNENEAQYYKSSK